MLNYNSAIKENKNYNNLTIKEIAPILKINIRGKKREFFTSVGKILNMILPTEANTSSANDKHTSIWLSPDEWLIHSNIPIENNNSYELEESLYANISKNNLGSVSDVSDQFVMINMEGKKMLGQKLFVPMENKTIKVTVTDSIFFDKENKRLNA